MGENQEVLVKSTNMFLDFLANLIIVLVKICVETQHDDSQPTAINNNVASTPQLKEVAPSLDLNQSFLDYLFEVYMEFLPSIYEVSSLEIILQRLQIFAADWINLLHSLTPLIVICLSYYNLVAIENFQTRVSNVVLTKPDATFGQFRGGAYLQRAVRQLNPFRAGRRGGVVTYLANLYRSFRFNIPLLSNSFQELNVDQRRTLRLTNQQSTQQLASNNLDCGIGNLIQNFESGNNNNNRLSNRVYTLDPLAFEMSHATQTSILNNLNDDNPLFGPDASTSLALSNIANYNFRLAQSLYDLKGDVVGDELGSKIILLREARCQIAFFMEEIRALEPWKLKGTRAKLEKVDELLYILLGQIGVSDTKSELFVKNARISQFVQNNNIDGLLYYMLNGETSMVYGFVKPPKLYIVSRFENFMKTSNISVKIWKCLFTIANWLDLLTSGHFTPTLYILKKLIGGKMEAIIRAYNQQLSPTSLLKNDYMKVGSSIFFTEAMDMVNSTEENFNPVYWYNIISCLSPSDKDTLILHLNCAISQLFELDSNVLRSNPQIIWLYQILYEDAIASELLESYQTQPEYFQEGVEESKE